MTPDACTCPLDDICTFFVMKETTILHPLLQYTIAMNPEFINQRNTPLEKFGGVSRHETCTGGHELEAYTSGRGYTNEAVFLARTQT